MIPIDVNWAVFESFDRAVFEFAEKISCTFLDYFLGVISFISDNGYIFIAVGLVMLLFKKTRIAGFLVIAAIGAAGVVNSFILKELFERARPYEYEWLNGYIFRDELFRPSFIPIPDSSSFPSGHTAGSFAAATVIWGKCKWKAGLPVTICAFIVGFSRIYVHDHFPSDVIGGIIVGVICGLLALLGGYILFDKIVPAVKKKKVKEKFEL